MPPEAPDAWIDVIQPAGMSRLDPIYPVSYPPLAHGRPPARPWRRFALLVLVPTLLAGAYFGGIAADRYVAEAHFVVKKPNAGPRGAGQSLSIEEGPKGFGGGDSYAVRDFLMSRDALRLLLDKSDFRAAVARGGIDLAWRFPSPLTGSTDEDLYRLYESLVSVDYDSSTGVTTLRTQGFSADDAKRIATTLIAGGEDLVNRMNERARTDAIRVAQAEVARARQEALLAQEKVTAFRDHEAVIDPTQLSDTVLKTIGSLSQQLVEARAHLDVTIQASPRSPQIAILRARVGAIQAQIDQERTRLAGNDRSLAPRIAEYERLMLVRGFAERSFLSALNLLEAARLDSQRQQAYLEQVVEPRAADEARYPRRILWILGTFLAGCAVFRLFRPKPVPVA